MTEWLRPVFGRAKSQNPLPSTLGNDRPANVSFDESTESEDGNIARLRPASRVSSYIGLRSNTNTPSIPDSDTFPNFRKPDNIYHEPSGDQMAEMLKVAVMKQGTFATLPIEYNSCILHVLEAYQGMRNEISKKEEEIEAMKQQHTEAIKDFEDMASRWEVRERDYQIELKKLEVLLSRTEGGMEKVTLARSKSTVHGSKKIQEVIRELRPIKQRESELDGDDIFTRANSKSRSIYIDQEGDITPKHEKKGPKFASTPFSHPSSTKGRCEVAARNQILNPQPSISSLHYFTGRFQNLGASNTSRRPPQAEVKAAKEEDSITEAGVAFNSASDTSTSSDESAGLEFHTPEPRYGIEKGLQKPVDAPPKSPLRKFKKVANNQATNLKTAFKGKNTAPNQMEFSFKPGDDLNILGQRSSLTPKKGTSEEGDTRHSSLSTSEQNSQPKIVIGPAEQPRRPRSAIPKLKQEPIKNMTTPKPSPEDGNSLHRYDSASSVLTAFRASSGRNSSNDSRRNSLTGYQRQGTERSGNNDAVTAAVRAVARKSKGLDEPRNSSGSLSDSQHMD